MKLGFRKKKKDDQNMTAKESAADDFDAILNKTSEETIKDQTAKATPVETSDLPNSDVPKTDDQRSELVAQPDQEPQKVEAPSQSEPTSEEAVQEDDFNSDSDKEVPSVQQATEDLSADTLSEQNVDDIFNAALGKPEEAQSQAPLLTPIKDQTADEAPVEAPVAAPAGKETEDAPEIEAFVADWFLNDVVATDLNERILSAIHTIASPKLKNDATNERYNFVAKDLINYFNENGRYLIDVINKFSVNENGKPNWKVVNQTKYDNDLLRALVNPKTYSVAIKIPAVLRLVERIQRGELELTKFVPTKKPL